MSALRGLGDIRLVLVGDGPSMPQLTKQFAGMPVTMLGALGGADLATAYASFDVFLHTGTEETFGQTVQEAHATGIPVIAPRAGGPIDLVDHGANGYLYTPGDDDQLRAYVEGLVIDGELRARMGEAGRRSVLGRSWEGVCSELVGYYEAAIARRAAPVPL